MILICSTSPSSVHTYSLIWYVELYDVHTLYVYVCNIHTCTVKYYHSTLRIMIYTVHAHTLVNSLVPTPYELWSGDET